MNPSAKSSDRFRRPRAFGLLWAVLLLSPLVAASPGPTPPGVVVEEVSAGSTLAKAGIRADDVLLAWERLPRPAAGSDAGAGELASPFDWEWLKLEQAPCGTITLTGERQGTPTVFTVDKGLWKAAVRPRMPAELLESYLKGRDLIAGGELDEGIGCWRQVAAAAGDWRLQCWTLLRIAEHRAEAQTWDRAEDRYREALEVARDPLSRVLIWDLLGHLHRQRGACDQARDAYRLAAELRQATWGETLGVATSRSNLARAAWLRGDLRTAEKLFRRALALREAIAPHSLELAQSVGSLGLVATDQGDLDAADGYLHRALAIQEQLAPDSLLLAETLNSLGGAAYQRGNLSAAENYYRQTLAIRQRLAPDSVALARSLSNLAAVALARGDPELADLYLRRALAATERLAPDSRSSAYVLSNLGTAALERQELELAEMYIRRALGIWDKLAPDGLEVARCYNNLGAVAMERGHFEVAEDYYRRGLAIREQLAPGSVAVALSLENLGILSKLRGDFAAAANYYRGSLAIREQLAPDGTELGRIFNHLALLAVERGDLESAQAYHQRVLAIDEKLVPNTRRLAVTFYGLAATFRAAGRLEVAADYFDRAIATLESHLGRLGRSHHVQAGLRARHKIFYQDAMEIRLEQQQFHQAFDVLERFRARSLLAMLAERDLAFNADLATALKELRNVLAKDVDRALRELAILKLREDEERITELNHRLLELQEKRKILQSRIRQASPRLAALQYPEPLTLDQVRKVLDPGVALLSYSVHEKESYLFVVTKDGGLLKTAPLAIAEEELRSQVHAFRHYIDQGGTYLEAMEIAGHELYKILIGPVAGALQHSQRLVIIPDGPLHLLPFAALLRKTGEERQYLIEWKPVSIIVSATVFAEFKRLRPKSDTNRSPRRIAAFADPHYSEQLRNYSKRIKAGDLGEIDDDGDVPDPRVRAAVKRDLFAWDRLPYTGQEVEGIAGIYPTATVLYLGESAVEERAKALDPMTDVVHFAVHGYLDDRFPLNSGLALSTPEGFPEDRENGLLQVWEIFEQVRLDADLVVLSACETALGEERWGEGLIGLTRAFHYAGARTVAGTLWQVSDRATPELVVRFYRHLRSGKPKDLALRAAQIELIRGGPIEVENASGERLAKDLSAPVYWAAFQLYGDWQ